MTEQWRPVVGYEGRYEVSDHGRVRSLDRQIAHPNGKRGTALRKGMMLSPGPNNLGYLYVSLCKGGNATRRATLHGVVCAAFHGPRPHRMEICHCDGDKTNNRADNLRYDTAKANRADKHLHGTMPLGERHHSAKLTEQQVAQIHALYGHVSAPRVASNYGVAATTIQRIWSGRIWAHAHPFLRLKPEDVKAVEKEIREPL